VGNMGANERPDSCAAVLSQHLLRRDNGVYTGFRDSRRFRFVHGNVTARELTANKIGAADGGGRRANGRRPSGGRHRYQNFPGTKVLLELAAGGRKRLLIGST
jgi:hypothetical protein